MLAATELGGLREDIVGTLSIVIGQQKANALFSNFENLIRQNATTGAKAAIPEIRAQVRQEAKDAVAGEIKPWLIGAYAVGGVALIGTVWALVRSK